MRMGMRITLLGVVLCCAFLQRPAAASDAMSDVMRLCKGRSEMAELVMRFRQLGTSAASMMEKYDDLSYRAMVLVAYDTPRYHSKEAIERSVQEFSSAAYMHCFNSESSRLIAE